MKPHAAVGRGAPRSRAARAARTGRGAGADLAVGGAAVGQDLDGAVPAAKTAGEPSGPKLSVSLSERLLPIAAERREEQAVANGVAGRTARITFDIAIAPSTVHPAAAS